MTEPSSTGSVQRPRPSPIRVQRNSVSGGSGPTLPGSPEGERYPYERVGGHAERLLSLTPDYHLSPPTPPLPPSPAAPPRGGERISNYTLASLTSLSDPTRPGTRRLSIPAGRLEGEGFQAPSPHAIVHMPTHELQHWVWQGGTFEASRAIAPAPLFWGAYLVDRLQRAERLRWDLAVGAGVLVSAGCLAHWQSLAMGVRGAPQSRFASPGRGPNWVGQGIGVAQPVALLASVIATLRGQHLGSRPTYTGGLLGTVFTYAIGHHVSAQLLERLPPWRPTHAPDGAQGPALMLGLCVAALVGATGLGARFDDWRWLLGFTVLSSTASFLSLREWRGAIGHWPMAPARPISQSTIELLDRSDSRPSSGGDHYVPQTPSGSHGLAIPHFDRSY